MYRLDSVLRLHSGVPIPDSKFVVLGMEIKSIEFWWALNVSARPHVREMSGDAVVEALQCACSQDPAVLRVGEQRLKAWEGEKGFYATLAVRAGRSS